MWHWKYEDVATSHQANKQILVLPPPVVVAQCPSLTLSLTPSLSDSLSDSLPISLSPSLPPFIRQTNKF